MQDQQGAIDSNLYFKDYRDITRYERQVVKHLLAREADNIAQFRASWEEQVAASTIPNTVTSSSIHLQDSGFEYGGAPYTPHNNGHVYDQIGLQVNQLVVRPADCPKQRPKHGNQGGKGIIKMCRRCASQGLPDVKTRRAQMSLCRVSRKAEESFLVAICHYNKVDNHLTMVASAANTCDILEGSLSELC
jgi:hypothetical protein